MSEVKWTEKQKEVIDDRGHNLLVSAAAGSGKTAVLVARILDLLVKDKVNIDEMLIATFTKAASFEMREKIYKKLLAEGLEDQIELMGRATIGSLDSFALSIVKKYDYVIGLDSNLKTCDASASAILKNEALEDLFEACFSAKDEEFIHFLDCYEKSDASIKNMILDLHNFLMSMPDPDAYMERCLACGDAAIDVYMDFAQKRCLSLLKKAKAYHEAFVGVIRDAGEEKLAEKAAQDLGYVDTLVSICGTDVEKCIEIIMDGHRNQTLQFKKTSLEPIQDEVKAIREHAKDILDKIKKDFGGLNRELLKKEQAAMASNMKTFFRLTKAFDEKYKEKKLLEKSLDFSDMNHYALAILENEDVQREYRSQFKYIFIDEFQDTNSLQEAIIKRIAREDNLFMVGDVKQCIYKFRLAEPEIFMKYYDDFGSGRDSKNKRIDLNANFRSKRTVIDSVNAVFTSIMTKENCDIDYDEAARLHPGLSYDGPLQYESRLELLNTTKTGSESPALSNMKGVELEALHAAKIIKGYHGKMIDDGGVERPLQYRDMVILLRATRTKGEAYYKALLGAGIPVYLDRSEGYFDSLEVQAFMNLLRVVDNMKQDIPLLAVLSHPIFGFNPDELSQIRIYGDEVLGKKEARFCDIFEAYAKAEISSKASDFIKLIESYKEEAKALPLADFVYHIMLDTGYGDFTAAQNAGEQKIANLKALIDKAESFEANNMSGLGGFLRYMDVLIKNKKNVDIGPAKIMGESADCVKIMTIHKSKGLEFPFVLMADLNGGHLTKTDSKDYVYHKDFGVAMRPVNPKTRVYTDTKLFSIINMKKNLESRAEELRVQYVAMTRAKDILILSANVDQKEKTVLAKESILPGDIDSASTGLDMIRSSFPEDLVRTSTLNGLDAFLVEREQDRNQFREILTKGFGGAADEEVFRLLDYPYFEKERPVKVKYSVSELAARQRSGFDHYKLSTSDEEEAFYESPQFLKNDETKLSGAEKGTAYHAVMEHIPFDGKERSISDIQLFISKLVENNILTAAEGRCVDPKKIKAFFASSIGKRAVLSKEIHKEAPFVMKHALDGYETLVQGTIDCYFEEDGKYVLLDYKSNYVDQNNIEAAHEHLRESYLPQLALYKEALEKITGKEVKEAVLYLFGSDEVLEVS